MEVNPVHSIIDLPSSWVQLGKIISTTDPRKLLTEYLRSLGIDDEFTRKLICSTNNMMRHVVFPVKMQTKTSKNLLCFQVGKHISLVICVSLPRNSFNPSLLRFVAISAVLCCCLSHVACRNFSRTVPHTCKLLSSTFLWYCSLNYYPVQGGSYYWFYG